MTPGRFWAMVGIAAAMAMSPTVSAAPPETWPAASQSASAAGDIDLTVTARRLAAVTRTCTITILLLGVTFGR
jgi:hypothetical protein